MTSGAVGAVVLEDAGEAIDELPVVVTVGAAAVRGERVGSLLVHGCQPTAMAPAERTAVAANPATGLRRKDP